MKCKLDFFLSSSIEVSLSAGITIVTGTQQVYVLDDTVNSRIYDCTILIDVEIPLSHTIFLFPPSVSLFTPPRMFMCYNRNLIGCLVYH